ncbi:hypothetical protein WJ542_23145 [Paraburkholderia sp. B3]|uniref:hypothetical protein n=1 Tax=Paraburkholderia sp. B3 TaxID=3134791 RepID=UPI0039826115
MIGAQAKDSIERIFFSAVRTRLVTDEQHGCEISPRPAEAAQGEHVVVLTISSMQFRLLLLLHFEDDEATRQYYLGHVGDVQRSLTECFMEFGNLCCGAMNQQLVNHFPDLGMSTPYALSSACLPYLHELKPDYVSTYALTLDGSVRLGATLCVCSQTPLDFVAAQTETASEGAGELELF